MKNIKIFTMVALTILIFLGCDKNSITKKNDGLENNKSEIKKIDKIEDKIHSMSLDDKIGQLFIVGFDGQLINDEIINLIKNEKVGGLIYFSRNIIDSNQIVNLNNEIKSIENDTIFAEINFQNNLN